MKCPNCGFIDKDEAFGDPATSAAHMKKLKGCSLKERSRRQTGKLRIVKG